MKAGDEFTVVVNGRTQEAGVDFHRVGRLLVFTVSLVPAVPSGGRWRRRRRPDVVDVRYVLDGHRLTARALVVDRAG